MLHCRRRRKRAKDSCITARSLPTIGLFDRLIGTGAFAKYKRTHLVEKRAAARRRKREDIGKCEGRKTRL
jgi:hypothetical protein